MHINLFQLSFLVYLLSYLKVSSFIYIGMTPEDPKLYRSRRFNSLRWPSTNSKDRSNLSYFSFWLFTTNSIPISCTIDTHTKSEIIYIHTSRYIRNTIFVNVCGSLRKRFPFHRSRYYLAIRIELFLFKLDINWRIYL